MLALVLFALSILMALRARTVVKAEIQTPSTSQHHTLLEEKGSLAPD
jgi:hypothetical protein